MDSHILGFFIKDYANNGIFDFYISENTIDHQYLINVLNNLCDNLKNELFVKKSYSNNDTKVIYGLNIDLVFKNNVLYICISKNNIRSKNFEFLSLVENYYISNGFSKNDFIRFMIQINEKIDLDITNIKLIFEQEKIRREGEEKIKREEESFRRTSTISFSIICVISFVFFILFVPSLTR